MRVCACVAHASCFDVPAPRRATRARACTHTSRQTLQMVVLLLFNDAEQLTYAKIEAASAVCRVQSRNSPHPPTHKLNPSTPAQMVVLLLFNDAEQLTYAEIEAATRIPEGELKRVLQSMSLVKVGLAGATACPWALVALLLVTSSHHPCSLPTPALQGKNVMHNGCTPFRVCSCPCPPTPPPPPSHTQKNPNSNPAPFSIAHPHPHCPSAGQEHPAQGVRTM